MRVGFAELEPAVRDLLAAQRYAVLGTQGAERPALNLMALAAMGDLRSMILATERATPKYANLRRNPRVSLLVDNRSNQSTDTQTALALTIDGLAEEVSGSEREQLAQGFLARHPQLQSLVHSSTCVLFRVRVERYELVRGLYDVREALLS
jgi:nitroimidazol reductase NimA-like FMN-containing flavoprotein (pyridoxamine 5'-phosphate oxidase superfamily)